MWGIINADRVGQACGVVCTAALVTCPVGGPGPGLGPGWLVAVLGDVAGPPMCCAVLC